MEVPSLLVALTLGLAAAAIGAVLAARLGQSVILGYIVAGVVIGSYTPGPVADLATVEALADIGIILLLFAIGVELSIRELLRVGRVAIVGGILQTASVIGIGVLVGRGLGWSTLAGLFFGAALAISSSTVLSKLLAERGTIGSEHGRISLGWAAVQDLGLIVLVVVFTALAEGGPIQPLGVAQDVGKALLFLVLLVPVGSRLLPALFDRIAVLRQREIFIVAVAAVALGMAYVATLFGLSAALGAFVAGVVVSESDLSHQILGSIVPMRDIFAGLFFVSVGMLVNPGYVVSHPLLVLLVVALIMVVKGLITTGLTMALGYPLRVAALAGVVLAQAGEFSFLLARLGVDLGVVTGDIFNVILTGSAVSIVLSPGSYRAAVPALAWLEKRRPARAVAPAVGNPAPEPLHGHAVICGYGRVGRLIGAALRRRGFTVVAIDRDREIINVVRRQGVQTLLGDAENPILLDHAHLSRARVLVIAIPDALAARQIVDYARQVNPTLDIVARSQTEGELAFMRQRSVTVVQGERELALEMARHTLRRFGLSVVETLAIVQRMRAAPVEDDPSGPDVMPH